MFTRWWEFLIKSQVKVSVSVLLVVAQFAEVTLAEELPLSSSLSSIFSISTISSTSLSSSSVFSSSCDVVSFLKGWKADSLNPGLNHLMKVDCYIIFLPEKRSIHEPRYSIFSFRFPLL